MPGNFTELIFRHLRDGGERPALVLPTEWTDTEVVRSNSVTFAQLARRSACFQAGLRSEGFKPGDRVVLMFPLGVDLYALVLAALASGVAVVLIDAGMGTKKILQALSDSGARGLVSVSALLRARWVLPPLWGLKKYSVDGVGLGVRALDCLLGDAEAQPEVLPRSPDDHALITFTSGTTGRPKGADRTHALLSAQHHALAEHFPQDADEVDMPCFPVVTLHNLCCGIPTVLPPVDFAAVSSVQPPAVWSWARTHGVTRMSGAPAYMEPLVACLEQGEQVPPTLRSLGIGGARVSRELCRRVRRVLPAVEAQVLYGSTEAEPIASVDFDEVLAAEGEGVLVGREAEAAEVALVTLPDPPPQLGQDGLAPFLTAVGELVVRGPHVNRRYLDNPAADRLNKLVGSDGTVWHRTGDLARRDDQGRLWLTGRVHDTVRVGGSSVHPFAVEEAGDALPGVARCALISGRTGRFVVELSDPTRQQEVQQIVSEFLIERTLQEVEVCFVGQIPMDRRHNSKIDRHALRTLLERRP